MKFVNRVVIQKFSALAAAFAVSSSVGLTGWAASTPVPQESSAAELALPDEPSGEPGAPMRVDRSGRRQVGKASFYADSYSGKTMADGTPMRLYSNNAASVTLPLGTIATVTNLVTGKSARIAIRDRGPYVKGRIVDLSPATARSIGISEKQGLALVAVTPLSIPGKSIGLASLAGR